MMHKIDTQDMALLCKKFDSCFSYWVQKSCVTQFYKQPGIIAKPVATDLAVRGFNLLLATLQMKV
jgi:hypothetical protein